ncbi:hypothetical protein REPUB_Repub02eG0102600 [Reevesia pubescens]
MEHSLEDFWAKLSLTDSERRDVVVEKEWFLEGSKECQYCLIGKLLSRKMVNVEAMRTVLSQVWKVMHGLTIKDLGDRIFMIQFGCEKEKDRIYMSQPWSFNKALLILQEIDSMSRVSEMVLDHCPFWIQAHGLSLGLMTERMAIVLGDSIGDVLEVESEHGALVCGKYLRFRVLINVSEPLKRGTRLATHDGTSILIMFRYERLPDLCYVCGRLTHHESECDYAFQMKKQTGSVIRGYGAWLNANYKAGVSLAGVDSANPRRTSMTDMMASDHDPSAGQSKPWTDRGKCVTVEDDRFLAITAK